MNEELTIGEVARLSGVTVRAIRHYEDVGLVLPCGRMPNGYRLFNRSSLTQVKLIRCFQEFGLSLKEIRILLERPEQALASLIDKRQKEIEAEIVSLETVCRRLRRWSQQLQQQPVCEESLKSVTEALLNLEILFPNQVIDEINRRHALVEPKAQREYRKRLEFFVRNGRGQDVRRLMERFAGLEGVNKAFASNGALRAVMQQHRISISSAEAYALRRV